MEATTSYIKMFEDRLLKKYTKEELKEMIVLAKRTDSAKLLDALMGKWKPD